MSGLPRSYDVWRTAGPPEQSYRSHNAVEIDKAELNSDDFSCFCANDCGTTFDKAEEVWIDSDDWYCSDECAGQKSHDDHYERAMCAAEDAHDARRGR